MKTAVSEYSARTATGSKNTKETLSIQKKQLLIGNRKKAFGLEYMNLMENNAPEEELEACVAKAMEEIATLKEKISKYEGRIATNQEELERKICAESFTQPSVTVTPSTDNEETPATASESNGTNADTVAPTVPYPTWADLNTRTSGDDDEAGTRIANESLPASAISDHIEDRSNVWARSYGEANDTTTSSTSPQPSAPMQPEMYVRVEPEPAEKPASGEGATVY